MTRGNVYMGAVLRNPVPDMVRVFVETEYEAGDGA